ncbi:hypothetical protein PVK06_036262 [Gossypium arboreum]|uniref:Uncharacterized protein n=1 Tax=Gossypium arboreum TaxID=29729 RepID=A0ABR0NJ10_GOSAR|nr:hypothetical protein PVK06_036262 [Gossypium arboreum]
MVHRIDSAAVNRGFDSIDKEKNNKVKVDLSRYVEGMSLKATDDVSENRKIVSKSSVTGNESMGREIEVIVEEDMHCKKLLDIGPTNYDQPTVGISMVMEDIIQAIETSSQQNKP